MWLHILDAYWKETEVTDHTGDIGDDIGDKGHSTFWSMVILINFVGIPTITRVILIVAKIILAIKIVIHSYQNGRFGHC